MTRVFSESDFEPCVDLFLATFAAPPWNETWDRDVVHRRLTQILRTPGFSAVVLGDPMIGFVMGNLEPWHDGEHFHLKEMCIHPDRQREGHGSRLLGFLTEKLRCRGAKRIHLLTARGDASEAFYAAAGFYTSPKMILMARRFEQDP